MPSHAICSWGTISLVIFVKGNYMETAILTLHYCRVHDLLFFPSLQEWLSFTPVQIEHTFGEVLSLTESACPRCLPQFVTASVLLEDSSF
jgi:hypothetical protein